MAMDIKHKEVRCCALEMVKKFDLHFILILVLLYVFICASHFLFAFLIPVFMS